MADLQRKTANLFDVNTVVKGRIDNGNVGYASGTTLLTISSNEISCTTNYAYRGFSSDFIPISTSNLYIEYEATSAVYIVAVYYDSSKTWLNSDVSIPSQNKYASLTVPTGAAYIRFSFTFATAGNYAVSNIMLNTGSTPLPYEPYGWVHSLRKLTTATDTLTTLPADLYADGNNATVGLVGNMSQTGTPTPQNPIQPQECGERTGNLLCASETATYTRDLTVKSVMGSSKFLLDKAVTQNDVSTRANANITLSAGTYTVSVQGLNRIGDNYDRIFIRDSNNNIIVQDIRVDQSKTFTLSETTTISIITFVANPTSVYNNTEVTLMLNEGSTALPYEPWGYKIPISSANTTTPVYLGEVESTRQIKQVVLTGQEDLSIYGASTSGIGFYFAVNDMMSDSRMNGYSSHFKAQITPSRSTIDGITFGASNRIVYVTFSDTSVSALNLSDITSIKQYIADQYSAGTPVTIWYVLATPTTGIVNEPIRKIGNYADEVSGITIPTITGKDTFDVETTLKPSEVSLSYTGWHDASVKEWDGLEWQ